MRQNPDHVPEAVAGVVSRAVGDDVLVVDAASGTAHSLTGPAADVWRAAGGPFPADDGVQRAWPEIVRSLQAQGLLTGADTGVATGSGDDADTARGVSQRDLLRRGGIVAVGVGITSLALPPASAAASSLVSNTYTANAVVSIPAGARSITITVDGAAGGASGASAAGVTTAGGAGGAGGRIVYTLAGPLGSALNLAIVVGTGGAKGGYSGSITPPAAAAGGTGYDTGGAGGVPSQGTTRNGGGGGGGSTGVTLTGASSGTLVAAGGSGGSGGSGLGGAAGDASDAVLGLSPGDNGATPNPTRPATGGLGGGQLLNVGVPSFLASGGNGTAGTGGTQTATIGGFGGGGGGGGVVGGTGGIPSTTTSNYSMGGGGGESGSNVIGGTAAFDTGPAGVTGAAGTNGRVTVSYTV